MKRAKKAKDRLGIRRGSKKKHHWKKAKLSGCAVITAVTVKCSREDKGRKTDDEEKNDAKPDDKVE